MYAAVCDLPLTISGSVATCPGTLASIDLSYVSSFDASMLDPVAVVSAIGSGFIVAGVPFLIVMVSRIFLASIKR